MFQLGAMKHCNWIHMGHGALHLENCSVLNLVVQLVQLQSAVWEAEAYWQISLFSIKNYILKPRVVAMAYNREIINTYSSCVERVER